jgi:hypothetical protein
VSRRRLRGNPVQVYLSDDELEAFDELTRLRGMTRSELVRRWIHRARSQRVEKTTLRPFRDPRQLTIPPLAE